MKKLTRREQYNRDGYWVSHVNSMENVRPYRWDREYFESLFSKGIDEYSASLRMLGKSSFIQTFLLWNNIVTRLDLLGIENRNQIICEQPVLHVMSPALRIPDGYYGTGAHQDWPSVQGSLDMITVWIPLTDVGVGNFPLEVIPGSHLGGLREGKINGSVLEIECDDKDFVPIECKAGDVIFFSGFLIHRTGAGSGFRVAVSQRFDNAAEETFIERGYPCAQKRIVDREIRWKPTPEQVRAVYA